MKKRTGLDMDHADSQICAMYAHIFYIWPLARKQTKLQKTLAVCKIAKNKHLVSHQVALIPQDAF